MFAGLLCVTAAGSSYSQQRPWLADRAYGSGAGYNAGSFVIHPGIAGEFGYDSNLYRRASSENPVEVFVLRITPSVSLTTAVPEGQPAKYRLDAGVSAGYSEYMKATDTKEKVSSFRSLGIDADADLVVNPDGRVGARFYGDAIRSVQPSNFTDTGSKFDRVYLRLGSEVIWKPGGGLFDWRFGYEYGARLFEENRFASLNYSNHALRTRGRWRFLPRTALVFDTTAAFVRYSNPGDNAYLLGSNPIRSRVGFNGLITNRFVLLALAGWGATFHRSGDVPVENFDSPIGQLQLTFYPTPAPGLSESDSVSLLLSSISVGYSRDFSSSYFGSYYGTDRGYLRAGTNIAQKLLLTGECGITNIHHPTLYFASGNERNASFDHSRYDVSLHAEYRFIPTIGVNASIHYDKSSSVLLRVDENEDDLDDLGFNRLRAFVGVRWFM